MGSPVGMRLALLSIGCGAEKEFPWFFHPLGFSVSGNLAAGAVMGNMLLVTVVAVVCVVAATLLQQFPDTLQRLFKNRDAFGLVKFPTAPLVVFMCLYQGLSLGGMVLTEHPPTSGFFLLGATTTIVCLALPFCALRFAHHNIPSQASYEPVETRKGRVVVTFLLGPGEWVSHQDTFRFASRFTCILRPYTQTAVCHLPPLTHPTTLASHLIVSLSFNHNNSF